MSPENASRHVPMAPRDIPGTLSLKRRWTWIKIAARLWFQKFADSKRCQRLITDSRRAPSRIGRLTTSIRVRTVPAWASGFKDRQAMAPGSVQLRERGLSRRRSLGVIRALAGSPQDIRLHDLRHTFASHAVMGGDSLILTGGLLGHRQAASTARYPHLFDHWLLQVARDVSRDIAK